MTYLGHVEPGGDAAVRELPNLIISKISVGPMDNNAYLLRDRATDVQVMIDAANDPDRLLDLIGTDGLSAVITTHAHPDHFQALRDVVDSTGATSFAGVFDSGRIEPTPDRLLDEGDVIHVGESVLTVVHLRGHTPGAIALVYDDPMGPVHLFTGDSLFPGGVGKTWSDEDFQTLYDDVTTKLFDRFSDEAWVYPGHGDDTTLGVERPHLSEWLARRW